jgi:hypothetical protein
MTDLDKLIEALEAGEARASHVADAFPGVGLDTPYFLIRAVCSNNDMNAAKALHDALLPAWDVDLELRPLGATIESGLSDVVVYQPYREGPGIRGCDAKPARAWLLAILNAHRSQVQS